MKNILLLLLCLTGCVAAPTHLLEITRDTNGVATTRELRMTTYAIWPATATMDKQHATMGKYLSVNTTGLQESTGGTNVVEALKQIDSIIQHLPKY